MLFTAIHRGLGHPPGPLTDEMLDAAVTSGLSESADLDWKRDLPPTADVAKTDFPKDIAAMANSGGGMIVYGVTETQKKATERRDVGQLTEAHERTLRAAAMSAISPPVLDLEILRLGEQPTAVAVIVRPSVDGPHLIYKNDYFGAPHRVEADTTWMRERDLEAAYRRRLADRDAADHALAEYYEQIRTEHVGPNALGPWMICVGRPRQSSSGLPHRRLTKADADAIWSGVAQALSYVRSDSCPPLARVDTFNPRPGLRRLTYAPSNTPNRWDEAWATLHDDGSVSLSGLLKDTPVGPEQPSQHERIRSVAIEQFVADFMAMVYASGKHHGLADFDVTLGVVWESDRPLLLNAVDQQATPLARYVPVRATVSTQVDEISYHRTVHELATDAVNQGGITYLRAIKPPPEIG